MKNPAKLISALIAAMFLGGAAYAQTPDRGPERTEPRSESARHAGVYLGFGPSFASIRDSAHDDRYGIGMLQVRGGVILMPQLAIEAEAGFGTSSEDDDLFGLNNDKIELDKLYGIYAVPRIPIGDRVGIVGRVGYAEADFDRTPQNGATYQEDFTGAAYGAGVDFDFSRFTLAINYTHYDFSRKMNSVGVTANARF